MTHQTPEAYIHAVAAAAANRSHNEPEFLQAMSEVLDTLVPVLQEHPEFVDADVL